MTAELIRENDSLNEGRKKINEAIKQSERAEIKSEEAVNIANTKGDTAISIAKTKGDAAISIANQALEKSQNTQSQLDQIVIEGDSSVEAAQARVKADGTVYNTLRDRLNDSDAQLMETKNKLKLEGWELQSKTRKIKPLVTFVDDDGRKEVLTKLKPLSEQYNIPFVVTVYVRAIEENPNYMNKEDLIYLQNELGWEISSHSYNHPRLDELSEEEQEFELRYSKEVLEGWGLKVNNFCYPFDSRNDKTYELVRKYYRTARRSYGGINTVPLETYRLRSVPLGSWQLEGQDTLEFYKSQVDKAIEQNGWLIFMTHCADPNHDDVQQQYLEQTIQYILSKNVEIVTFDQASDILGNIIDIGDFTKDDLYRDHFVVGVDGSVSSSTIDKTVMSVPADTYNAHNVPSDFPPGKVIYNRVTTSNSDGMPILIGGTLKTTTVGVYGVTSLQYSNLVQEYYPFGNVGIYRRRALDAQNWSDWKRVDSIDYISPPNNVSNDSPINEFREQSITYTRISAPNATGFPETQAGMLITNRLENVNSLNWQEYHVYNSNNVYRRYWTEQNTWSDWELLNSSIIRLAPNSVTADTPYSEFKNRKISYCQITLANANGFPNNQAGTLITNRLNGDPGYCWQEYKVYNSFDKFKRYCKSDGTWSEWKKFTIE